MMKMKMKFPRLAALMAGLLAIFSSSVFAATSVKSSINGQPGAVGDGNNDDTAAIDRAINADNAVYFPPGHYKYTNPNRMGLPGTNSYRLYGDGAGNSFIEFYGNPYNGILMFSSRDNQRTLTVEGLTLKAMTAGCGDAINAQFDSYTSPSLGQWKTRCLTVRNVQIQATDRSGSPTGYWNTGIYMWQAVNSVIDDVQMEGKFQYGTGIYWGSASTFGTTQLMLNNLSMLYFATGLKADGHFEGIYMSNFELSGIGTWNSIDYAIDLDASGLSHPPVVIITNGHLNFLAGGLHCRNVAGVKVANVNFAHVGYEVAEHQSNGTHLYLDDVWTASVANCDFAGPGAIPAENGVFSANGTQDVQVTGCQFSMSPTAGSALVALAGTSRTRWLDSGFNSTINRYDNRAGSQTFIRDIP
jgi:hypothetical protein